MTRAWFVLFCTMLLVPVASANWSSFHGDARNTGLATGEYELFSEVWWTSPSQGGFMDASIIVADGHVIVADRNGLIRVLDQESGNLLWQTSMSRVTGTPAVASGRLFVADEAGLLQSFHLQTGAVLEAVQVGATRGSLTAAENKIFVGTEAGEMHAYQASTLTLLWKFSVTSVYKSPGSTCAKGGGYTAAPIRGAPAVHSDIVFFGAMNNLIVAVNEEGNGDGTTSLLWHNKTLDVVVGAPAIDAANDRVIVGSYDGSVYAFDATPNQAGTDKCTGFKHNPLWKFNVPGGSKIHSSPAIDGNKIYFGTNGGHLYALSKSGQQQWATKLGESVTSSPAVAGDYVIVPSDDPSASTFWLHTSNGTIAKSYAMSSPVKASPAVVDSKVFVADFDGTTYMFGPLIPKRADLTVASVTAVYPGLQITIRNLGDAPTPATTALVTVAGKVIDVFDVSGLDPGASTLVTYQGELESGLKQVRVEVDPNHSIDERDESNNIFDRSIDVEGPPPPPPRTVPGFGLVAALGALVVMALRRRQ